MVVNGWSLLQLFLSCMVLSSLVIWGLVTIGLRRERKRTPPSVMPVIQPMAEDYLSDILDVLHSIEERLNK
jgi:hypothetical protein